MRQKLKQIEAFLWRRPVLALVLLLLPLILRISVISNGANALLLWQTVRGVLLSDAPFYTLLLLLFALPKVVRTPLLLTPLRILFFVLLALYTLDILIYMFFSTRLILADLFKFYRSSIGFFGDAINLGVALLLIALLILSVLFFLLLFSKRAGELTKSKAYRTTLFLLLLLSAAQLVALLRNSDGYIHKWEYSNYLAYNYDMLAEQRGYSDRFVERFVEQVAEESCRTVPKLRKKIILINVESLSSFQSELFSGLNNWTPEIDQIARTGRWFPDFIANGFQTEDGLISLLLGMPPVYPPASFTRGGGTSFTSFYHRAEALPHFFLREGYRFLFLEGADLSFSNKENWLRSNGVNEIISNNDPAFADEPRFVFQSIPDRALLKQAIVVSDTLRHRPYFLYIMTISNHTPFVDPDTGERHHQKTTRYTDRAVGEFYRALLERRFFDDGILIIVGDHRMMVPVTAGETERYGDRAAAKVPLIVVDGTVEERRIDGLFQQIDLYNGLKSAITGEQCTSIWRGDAFADSAIAPRFAIHRRGDNRTTYSVFSDEGDHRIVVDGDRTGLVSSKEVAPEVETLLVNRLNALRLSRLKESDKEK